MVERNPTGRYLIAAFLKLGKLRQNGFSEPEALQPRQILDWCEVTGEILNRDEITIILAMDAAFRSAVNRRSAERRGTSAPPPTNQAEH